MYLAYASGSWLGLVWLRLGLSQLGWGTFPQVSLFPSWVSVPNCRVFSWWWQKFQVYVTVLDFYLKVYDRFWYGGPLCKVICKDLMQAHLHKCVPSFRCVTLANIWLNKTSHVVRCNVKAAEKYISLMDWGKGSEYWTVIQSRYFIYTKFLPGKKWKKWKTPKLFNWISLY